MNDDCVTIEAATEKSKSKRRAYNLAYRERKKAEIKEQRQKYYLQNREKILNYSKQWAKNNRESVRARDRRYAEERKARAPKETPLSAEERREKRRESNRKYRRTHSAQIKRKEYLDHYRKRPEVKRREYEQVKRFRKKKIKSDPVFKLQCYLRKRVKQILTRGGLHRKSAKTFTLIGCSLKEFRTHIESKMKKGMSWKNWGRYGWHLDHIVPCAAFDLSKPEEQRRCFHYTNLQPLWAAENHKKGDAIVDCQPELILLSVN